MKLNRFGRVLLVAAPVLLAGGCVNKPILSVQDASVSTSRPVSLEEVGRTIMRAGSGMGLQMKSVKPGLINATHTGSHYSAVMEIRYDTKRYNIAHKDSQGMKYDGNTIHFRYNEWVQRLDKAIRAQLSAL
jgi:hypothetical protein